MVMLNNALSETEANDIYLRLDNGNIPTANYVWTTNLELEKLKANDNITIKAGKKLIFDGV